MKAPKAALAIRVALITVALLGGPASAQDKTKMIADREALMKDQGRQWVVIRNYVQGKGEQAAAIAAAESLSKSVPTVPNYFPPGSEGPNHDGKYGPKPEVWSKRNDFLAADKKVVSQIAALDTALRSGDNAKVAAAFKDLDFCSSCHNDFRAKLQ
ncbi:MAG TPA: cytochrome c [Stellaceae bacterium]|nr:cytochrome c [Stellaceae bacterium]